MKQKLRNIQLKSNNLKKVIISIAALAIVVFIASRLFYNSNTTPIIANNDTSIKLAKPISQTNVGNSFEYAINDKEGNEVGRFRIVIESASLEKEIVVKGRKNKAVDGRAFMILNLKIQNDFNRSVDINTKDYFRLVVNGKEDERLAPEIHNDPVKVQAISTKLTRVGFTINEKDTNLVLYVGEINGEKQRIELNLQK